MEKGLGGTLIGLFAGAGLFGLVQGALRLPLGAEILAADTLGVCLAGALVAALLAWLGLRALLLLRLLRVMPGAAAAFWIGVGLGMAPLTHNLLFLDGGTLAARGAVAVGVPALFLSSSPWLGRWMPPPSWLPKLIAVLALLAYPLAALLLPGRDAFRAPELPLGVAYPAQATVSAETPDVVLVSIDTLRADAILDPQVDTPNLDRLRAEGAWAPYALASSNQTLPSHVGLLTGTGAVQHGVLSNVDRLPDELPLVSEQFRARGWQTAGVVSNGLLRAGAGFGRGWDLYDDALVAHTGSAHLFLERLDDHTVLGWLLPTPWLRLLLGTTFLRDFGRLEGDMAARGSGALVLERAAAVLEELQRNERPYFLFLHTMDPHSPYGAPPPFRGRHTAGLELPPRYALDRFGRVSTPLTENIERDLASRDEQTRADARAAAEFAHAMYREEVEFVDSVVGELLAKLEAGGRPTVLLFTADHGEHFGEHALMEHANSLFEPLLRVPFVLWGSGVEARRLPPVRLADAAGLLLACGRRDPEPAAEHTARDAAFLAVREGERKWITNLAPSGEQVTHRGFFRLADDPAETQDLGVDAVSAPLQEAVRQYLADRPVRDSSPLDADTRTLLRMMGYVDGAADEDEEEPADE